MSERKPGKAARVPSIEGLRGLAALYVAIGHIATLIDPNRLVWVGGFTEAYRQITRPLWFGHLAVAAFITISGFCLMLAYDQRRQRGPFDWWDYIKRRSRRILPPYYACLAFSLLVCYTVTMHQAGMPWIQYLPVTQENMLAHVFMVHNLRPEWMYKINGVLWSIAIEYQIYFLFPLMVWLLRRTTALGLLLATGYGAYWLTQNVPGGLKLYFWYLGLFAVGMVFARLSSAKPQWVLPGTGVAGLGLMVWSGLLAWDRASILADIVIATGIGLLMAAFWVRPESVVSRIVGCRPVAWLGLFSYSLYLMHHPIYQVVYVNHPAGLENAAEQFRYMLVVGLPAALVGSFLFFLVFERPFMTSSKRKPNEKPVESTPQLTGDTTP